MKNKKMVIIQRITNPDLIKKLIKLKLIPPNTVELICKGYK